MAEQFNQIEPLNYKHRTVEAEVDEGEVAIFTARMGLKVDEARALRDWLNAALPEGATRIDVDRVALDEKFQEACQRYAQANGSSAAIAAAALKAAGLTSVRRAQS